MFVVEPISVNPLKSKSIFRLSSSNNNSSARLLNDRMFWCKSVTFASNLQAIEFNALSL